MLPAFHISTLTFIRLLDFLLTCSLSHMFNEYSWTFHIYAAIQITVLASTICTGDDIARKWVEFCSAEKSLDYNRVEKTLQNGYGAEAGKRGEDEFGFLDKI